MYLYLTLLLSNKVHWRRVSWVLNVRFKVQKWVYAWRHRLCVWVAGQRLSGRERLSSDCLLGDASVKWHGIHVIARAETRPLSDTHTCAHKQLLRRLGHAVFCMLNNERLFDIILWIILYIWDYSFNPLITSHTFFTLLSTQVIDSLPSREFIWQQYSMKIKITETGIENAFVSLLKSCFYQVLLTGSVFVGTIEDSRMS